MKYCNHCNKEFPDDNKFCHFCGESLVVKSDFWESDIEIGSFSVSETVKYRVARTHRQAKDYITISRFVYRKKDNDYRLAKSFSIPSSALVHLKSILADIDE